MHTNTIEHFLSHADLQLNSILARQYYAGAEVFDDSAILTYNIPTQYTIDELLDLVDESMELVILYHVIPSNATVMGEQCCAYSDPILDDIYKLNCITNDDGLCETIYVTLYDSLEMLGSDVQDELVEQTSKSHEVVFSRPLNEVLRDFIR